MIDHQISKCNLSLDCSSHEEDEDVGEQLSLSHLKVDEVPKKNFSDHSPPTLLTLGVPGVENHELMFGTNYSSTTQSDCQQPQHRKIETSSLDRESRGKKRKCGEDIHHLVSQFDANGSGMTSTRNEEYGLQQYSKASSRRRDQIAKKVKVLKELIPNCNKSGRVAVLDQAIQYIQALQHEVQVMSMDGIPAWHSASTLLAARNQIMQSTLQFNPYIPIMPRVAIGSFFGFGTSINYSNMSNLFPMMSLTSTGSHFPFLHLAFINNLLVMEAFSQGPPSQEKA
ncbi:hypothetical protein RND71_010609 [Anisodus tanguticus]|uniref:BHLH domain-containing protein n=1 Tax=Anisodus tanguticus TaxID=243964 RepID=A0AAE1SK46_9SOLA|nr:hypothetical protein RND71_010609 [Anisodus tanguticus]